MERDLLIYVSVLIFQPSTVNSSCTLHNKPSLSLIPFQLYHLLEMPGESADYRRKRGKSRGRGKVQSNHQSQSRQSDSSASRRASPHNRQSSSQRQSRQLDSSVSNANGVSGQMPSSVLISGQYDNHNSKVNELKSDLSDIHDFYGYDATSYYLLAVSKKYQIWFNFI